MQKPSQAAIHELGKDPFFEMLTEPGFEVHRIMKKNDMTVAVWSDKVGYSVSYKYHRGQGTGGVLKTLESAIREAKARMRLR